jgi:NADH-quinone oxidoreductase subunit K
MPTLADLPMACNYFVRFSYAIFCIGLFGLFGTRKNMLIVLMSIEIMLLAGTFNFSMFFMAFQDFQAQVFALIILTVAAAESSVGLALIVLIFRHRAIISIDSISFLKG